MEKKENTLSGGIYYLVYLIKSRWKHLVGLALVVLLATIYFFQFNPIPKKLIILVFILAAISILMIKEKIEVGVFYCIIIMGGVFSFVTPVLDTPDEPAHLARTFYVAEGHFGMTDNPENLKISKDYQEINQRTKQTWHNDLKNVKHSKEKEIQEYITPTSTYSFLGYVPQALGLIVAKVLSLNLYWTFYLGRIFNLIVYALLAFLAVKKAKYFKQMFALIAVFPMSIYIAASFNQDAFANGVILLACSYLINMLFGTKKIPPKDIWIFALLCLVIISSKLPYVLLAGMLLFIEPKKYLNKKTYLTALILLGILVLGTLLWYLYYSGIKPVHRSDLVNPSEQLIFMKNNVVTSIRVLLSSLVDSVNLFQMNFNFGWLKYFSVHVCLLYTAFFGGMCFFFPFKRGKISTFNKAGLVLVILGIMVLISLSQYLTWTPVGQLKVIGVQGRYFIGLLVLVPIITNNSQLFYNTESLKIEEQRTKKNKSLETKRNLWLLSAATYFIVSMLLFTIAFYSIHI